MSEKLEKMLGIKMTEKDLEKLKKIAEKQQRKPSDLARIIIRNYLSIS